MSLFEDALAYGGIYSHPGNLAERRTALAAAKRRLPILEGTLQRAQEDGSAAVPFHAQAVDETRFEIDYLERSIARYEANIERAKVQPRTAMDDLKDILGIFLPGK